MPDNTPPDGVYPNIDQTPDSQSGQEIVTFKDIPLYLPDEFDQKVETDPQFRDSIAGCTTIGYEHFKKGVTDHSVSVLPYGQPGNELLYAMLAPETFTNVIDKQFYGNDVQNDVIELINDNRDYGNYGVLLEAIGVNSSLPFKEVSARVLDNLNHFGDLKKYLSNYQTNQGLEIALTYLNPQTGMYDPMTDLSPLGLTVEDLPKVRTMIEGREGVQVIYNKSNEFTDFLLEHAAYIPDRGQNAIDLEVAIPGKFILGIVPIGKSEQEALRNWKSSDKSTGGRPSEPPKRWRKFVQEKLNILKSKTQP
jgi:hypothetical protein